MNSRNTGEERVPMAAAVVGAAVALAVEEDEETVL
jgi:hypothetical protein